MTEVKSYVREDEHGVLRIGSTRVPLDSVYHAWDRGDAPESIQRQYPSLSLEEVYGAITFVLANPSEVRKYLDRQDRTWEEARRRSEADPAPVVQRLRLLKHSTPSGAAP